MIADSGPAADAGSAFVAARSEPAAGPPSAHTDPRPVTAGKHLLPGLLGDDRRRDLTEYVLVGVLATAVVAVSATTLAVEMARWYDALATSFSILSSTAAS